MSAVNKVVTMLTDLQAKVMNEGESEAATYNKFACFCKDTIGEKTDSINVGQGEKDRLETEIADLASKRDTLDTTIKTLSEDIEQTGKEMAEAKDVRAKEASVYKAEAADLEAGLAALKGAIEALKASKPSLLQVRGAAEKLRVAALLAETLGFGGSKLQNVASSFMQQAPDVAMENYKFHSGGVIETLESLLASFRDKKVEVDAAEVAAKNSHTLSMQDQTAIIQAKNVEMKDAKGDKAEKHASIASASERLTTVDATLLDDKEYLSKLAKMCSDKKKTWDKRSSVREDELSMLTQVIGIIEGEVANKTSAATIRLAQRGMNLRRAKALATDEHAMEALEAQAEAAEASGAFFFQEGAVSSKRPRGEKENEGRLRIVDLLRSKGKELHSSMLTALASQIYADPLAKVKTLIQELIERLLQESANEATQKAWCDKSTEAATQKRTYAAEAIAKLNSRMADHEAIRDELAEELGVLASDIGELVSNREKAEQLRDEERFENNNTVVEATEGLDAISMAIDIVDKFYKTAAKAEVSLAERRGPADDAPDAGFGNFEAYTGGQGEASGILGMMEIMQSDFTRTIKETQKAEEQAEQEHLSFMTESGKSLEEKKTAEAQKAKEKDSAEQELFAADESLTMETETLQTSIKELLELKTACIDIGMSYEERVARRKDEMEALKKALCILENYEAYGPDGAADNC